MTRADDRAHRDAGLMSLADLDAPSGLDDLGLELRMRGVAVTPSSAFATTRNAPAAVRLCLCEPPERETLQRGLEIIASTARGVPGAGMINAEMGVV